jgi:CRISPR-associated endonuclease Cas3-HD
MAKEKILAKSTGQSLIEHSTLVSRIAVEIASTSMLAQDENLLESVRLAGLLHDIGKCTKFFQKKINKDLDESNIEAGLKYRHNEVGWAFLSRYLTLPKKQLSIILDSVYWHHGISNKLNGYNDTDIVIDELDIETMVSYLKEIIEIDNIGEKPYKPKKAPIFYTNDEDADEKNSEYLFARTCIISADRIASSLTSVEITDEEIKTLVNEATLRPIEIDVKKHCFFGNSRFIKQLEIVDNIQRTTQINAPAGFGKTLLGLLWNFRRGRKLIWVCPRNIVAESIYKSITEELENFGVDFLSTELYLSGEVQDSNKLFNGDFKSDIIVTNIDNYLSPSVENRNASRLHTIINSDVIFDEFHELIGENALFGK